MNEKNIILTGVGGQGLVLTTQIICEAAFDAGYDVKSNDVVGLSQRGGKVWGSVRIGEKIYSPNVPPKSADILLALEPLEGLRWSGALKDNGVIIMNVHEVAPVFVIAEKEEYPSNIEEELSQKYEVNAIDAVKEGNKLGSSKVANTFLLGKMANYMEIPLDSWKKAIRENVPKKFVDMNIEAFDIGYRY
ncbi:indolepyruvate oxidoreductase subunit beta [Clostridiisalibacter paucivorans]|uniref:indolepyruvate oxidoreductase subunit beta n=1 Tax=Clostridiisalibacter paucivorans TaxID=408753 RepID=UPI00047A69FA|nr:indolepyruvate oxidoreductase subunit beta [Clostridiisalibacter paucivorans]